MIAISRSILFELIICNFTDLSETGCNSVEMMGVVCCVVMYKMSKGHEAHLYKISNEKSL